MPGLAKVARRRRRRQRRMKPLKPEPILDWHTRTLNYTVIDDHVPPLVFVAIACDADAYRRYRDGIAEATTALIRTNGNAYALDLFAGTDPVGRFITNACGNPTVPTLAEELEAAGSDRMCLQIGCPNCPDEELELELAVRVEQVTEDEFHGPTVELGSGEFCAVTFSMHDGTMYVHRFETEEEATAQLERNLAKNEPFVGADLD